MDSTLKKKQPNRRFFSELDDFEQNIFFRNTMSNRQEDATVNEGT